MRIIEIMRKGTCHHVKVDDVDYEWLSNFRCYISLCNGKFYVRRHLNSRKSFIHRELLGEIPSGMRVDHINGDSLDNRRCNLRISTPSQNNANSIRRKSPSGFKGVQYDKSRQKWRARLMKNYKEIHLGRFDSIQEAVQVYDAAAKKHFGEFARTNAMQRAQDGVN